MPLASELYMHMLRGCVPRGGAVQLRFETIYPCSSRYTPPSDAALGQFDGCCFTGSSLSAYDDGSDVHQQLELMERTFACGVSSFGSCWGLQVAAQALGGTVEPIGHRGREVGIGRKITMTAEGPPS